MGQLNFIAIFRESFTLIVLLGCSILSITFAIERWLTFRKAKVKDPDNLIAAIKKLLQDGKSQDARAMTAKMNTPLGRVFTYILDNYGPGCPDMDNLLATKRQEERIFLERYMGILGTMGNTAPFIGLFGTVVGIIKAFRDLALSGVGGPAVVAKGIAEALVATAGGLAVAIPAVILYNYFMRKLKVVMSEVEIYSTRLVIALGIK